MDADELIDAHSAILSFLSVYIVENLNTSVRLRTHNP
jgi:hypothetical protein